MTNRNTKGGLVRFVKDACANWDRQHGHCIGTNISQETQFNTCGECWVIEGRPCKYFERCVLGPVDYKYRLPGWDYEKLFELYAQINPAHLVKQVRVRRCECGAALKPRHRCCEDCKRKHRLLTYRRAKRKCAG
jgi:hypothetical protein